MKQKLLFAFIMGTITTGLVSFTLTSVHHGFGNHFLDMWLRAWSTAIIPALFSIVFISPRVLRMVNELSEKRVREEMPDVQD